MLQVLGKNTDAAIVGYTGGRGWGGRPVLLTGEKKSGVPDWLRPNVWALRISFSVIKFTLKKKLSRMIFKLTGLFGYNS